MTSRSDIAEPNDTAPHGVVLRRAIRFSYVAAALWACGNTLSSGLMLTFLAQELGGGGRQIAYLQVAPALFGMLRLFTPLVIGRLRGTKRTCIGLSLVAYALLLAAPAVIAIGRDEARRGEALALLIGLFCVHQLLEQIATIALWTWLTDLVPRRFRGRYFSRRNMLQLVVIIPTLLASGEYIDRAVRAERAAELGAMIANAGSPTPRIAAPQAYAPAHYAVLIAGGAGLLMVSLVPLALMPTVALRLRPVGASATGMSQGNTPHFRNTRFRMLLASLYEPAARRMLIYGCWFSFFNGLFMIAQNIFPKGVLKLGLADVNWMQTVMRVGQIGASAIAGPTSDRRGNRLVIVVCQLLVGAAPLFYFLATPNSPYWLYGAWLLWSAYAGINICVPNLVLKLAPPAERSAHYATYQAVTSVFLVAGTLAGGYAFDAIARDFTLPIGDYALDKFRLFFLGAIIMRSAGALIVATVPEPGTAQLREVAASRRE